MTHFVSDCTLTRLGIVPRSHSSKRGNEARPCHPVSTHISSQNAASRSQRFIDATLLCSWVVFFSIASVVSVAAMFLKFKAFMKQLRARREQFSVLDTDQTSVAKKLHHHRRRAVKISRQIQMAYVAALVGSLECLPLGVLQGVCAHVCACAIHYCMVFPAFLHASVQACMRLRVPCIEILRLRIRMHTGTWCNYFAVMFSLRVGKNDTMGTLSLVTTW